MRFATCVFMLLALAPGTAGADDENLCRPGTTRPALIAGGGWTEDPPDAQPYLPPVHGPFSVGHGPAVQARVEIPLMNPIFGLRLEIDRTALPVHLGGKKRKDWVSISHGGVGIVAHLFNLSPYCGYIAVTKGTYGYAFRGERIRSSGDAVTLGLNRGSTDRLNPFIEVRLSGSLPPGQSPDDALADPVITVSAGARFRF